MQPNVNRLDTQSLTAPTGRGRGRGHDRQNQPLERGTPTPRSGIPVLSPSRSVTRGYRPRGVVRAGASMLQSARQVGISGGTFNTAGTQQFNITLNLGNQSDAEEPQNPIAGSSRDQEADDSREARAEALGNHHGHYDPTPWPPNPPVQRSSDIYYRHIAIKGRGSPLWIPGPNKNLHITYQRRGMMIGDVGIITASGSFDFLFNMCLPHDHPFNPPELPENFTPLTISPLDIQNYSEFEDESYLSSASVRKSRTGGLNDLTFESSASEGAILTMPVGSRSEDVTNTARLRNYLAIHAEPWYNYVVGVRGREIQNGDLRLVVGWDKTKAWGMATFSNASAQQESFLLQFRPIEQGNAGRTYGWVYSGFAEVRAGPGAQEKVRIRMDDPSQAGVEYENQCLFIRTLNVNLQDEVWMKVASEFGLADVVGGSSNAVDPSYSRFSREDSRASDSPFGYASQSTSTSMRDDLAASLVPTSAEEDISTPEHTHSIQSSPLRTTLDGHPSRSINKMLLKLRPNARMAITEDKDWISVLQEDDTILPNAQELFKRMMESFHVLEEEGVVFVQPRDASPATHPQTALISQVDVPSQKDSSGTPPLTHYASSLPTLPIISPSHGDSTFVQTSKSETTQAQRPEQKPSIQGSKPLYLSSPFADAALLKGNFKTIVMLPKYIDVMEWVAVNVIEFYTNLNGFYLAIAETCTQDTCPTMSAGPSVNYLWTSQGGKQAALPAPTYIDNVMTFIQNLINDENIFPVKSDQSFHPSFPRTARAVFRQLLRVFAHIYHAHYTQILHLRSEAHLNSLFAHFLAFGREFELLEVRDIKGEPKTPVGVGLLWERWKEKGVLGS